MTEVVITGITTVNTTATEVTVVGYPGIKSITLGTLVLASTGGINVALTVVTATPTADKEIQLTAQNKFKLYMTTGATAAEVLVLECVMKDELVRT